MIITTFSYLWTSSAIDAISELVRHGYRAFEVPISSPHCWPDEMSAAMRSEAKKRLRDYGASVPSLNAGGYDLNLASPAANMRRKSIDHIKDVIDLAVEWGAHEVVISPGTRRPMISPPLSKTFEWVYESLGILLPFAEKAGIRLLLENTPYCFTPTIGEMAEIVEQVRNDHLQIVYDVANGAFIGEDTVAGLFAHHASIALMHISDTGLEVWGHDPIGTGVINFKGLGAAIEATGKTDKLVLEIIRVNNPVAEIDQGIRELNNKGWKWIG
jgi:sugar phosphate isomerase/epimerase